MKHTIKELKESMNNTFGFLINHHSDFVGYSEIVEILNKQIPKKPLMVNDFPKCPECFNFLVNDSNGGYYNYCQDCGTKLDWSKE